jgi:hypothetical protein
MPLLDIVIFSSQNQVDSINVSLNPGMGILPFDHDGFPAMFESNLTNLLAYEHGLSQDNIDTLNALPRTQILIPTDEETIQGMQLPLAPIGQFKFVLEGNSSGSGKFMTVATKMAIPSNLTPAVLPANLHVVSMLFMNEVDGANEDIKIYLNASLIYTWSLSNARYAIINADDSSSPIMALPERGVVSAEIINTGGTAAKDGYLEIFFRLAGETTPGEFVSPTL